MFLGRLVATNVCSGWIEVVPRLTREQSLATEGLVVLNAGQAGARDEGTSVSWSGSPQSKPRMQALSDEPGDGTCCMVRRLRRWRGTPPISDSETPRCAGPSTLPALLAVQFGNLFSWHGSKQSYFRSQYGPSLCSRYQGIEGGRWPGEWREKCRKPSSSNQPCWQTPWAPPLGPRLATRRRQSPTAATTPPPAASAVSSWSRATAKARSAGRWFANSVRNGRTVAAD